MRKIHQDITLDQDIADFMSKFYMGRKSGIINEFLKELKTEHLDTPNIDYTLVQIKVPK